MRPWVGRRWARTHPHLARLQEHLGPLKLVTLPARRDPVLQEASAPDVTDADVLDRLRAEEVAAKSEQDVAMRTVMARFPSRKTRESFDCGVQPSVDGKTLQELATCRFLEHGDNVVVLGPPGPGKTPWAIAVGLTAVQQGYRTPFTAATTRIATRTTA
jgi:DNA replication protein DnaC